MSGSGQEVLTLACLVLLSCVVISSTQANDVSGKFMLIN